VHKQDSTYICLHILGIAILPHYGRKSRAKLSAHHLAEDEVAFPYLRPKLPEVPFDELMTEHSQQHLQSPFLGIPFVLYNLPADERAIMTAMMPPAVTQQLVPVDWKQMWAPMQLFLLD
jgi:hypothetical protein